MKQFDKLISFAEMNQIPLNKDQVELFGFFLDELLEKNKQMNLTAIVDPEEVELKHFIDSVSAAPLIHRLWRETLSESSMDLSEDSFRLADIGTGAGFPGIPLKILFPKAEFLLLDSLEKRIRFVIDVISEMKLEKITAKAGRVEEFAKAGSVSRETFDFCVTRAVANISVLAEYCLPMIKLNGHCVLYKSGNYEDELNEAGNAISLLGGEVTEVQESSLYGSEAKRSLIVIKKIKTTPDKYPRRPGKPSKSPIK